MAVESERHNSTSETVVKQILKLPTHRSSTLQEVGLASGPWSLTDHGKRAEMKINHNPFDIDSWEVLLREAQVHQYTYITVHCIFI